MIACKEADTEPIPGYRLIERLGSGGFGEVWKCEAPGGLFKAIKFVFGDLNALDGDGARAEDELRAVERIKSLRHPFLLSMDRVECIDGELVIVMELADQNLHELWHKHRRAGRAGIPRTVLLRYLREAAEVLDLMNQEHHLQHLDIKPHNLFLVSNHVKVGDFGLVNNPSAAASGQVQLGAITPLYASPELFQGKPSRFSDQYSLAIVYQELLTGILPFDGKNARQLLLQHMRAEPELRGLPEPDRPVVARALAKTPEERFESCMDFVVRLQAQGGRRPAALGVAPLPARPTTGDTADHPAATVKVPKPAPNIASGVFRENLNKVIADIVAAHGSCFPEEAFAVRPVVSKDEEVLRYRFRVGLSLAAARAKLESFVEQCYGRLLRDDDRGCGFSVPLPSNNWSQWSGRQTALDVQIILDPLAGIPIEVAAHVRALGCPDDQRQRLLYETGLPLLGSLRTHLLIDSQQRAQERLPWPRPLRVRALYPGDRQGEPIVCRGKDISFSGIGFILPRELDSSEVLLDLPSSGQLLTVPATLIRVKRRNDGMYDVGALFRLPAPA